MKKERLFRFKKEIDWHHRTVPIDELQDDINKLKNEGVTHIKFDVSVECGDSYLHINPYIERYETDAEHNDRLNREKKVFDLKEKQELAQLKRLQKKYQL